MADPDAFFVVECALGFQVRTSPQYWDRLLLKHPDLTGRHQDVVSTLATPDEVRRSRRDPGILLFYRRDGRYWLVAVVRRLNGDGFLITAYRADSIKEGERLWPR